MPITVEEKVEKWVVWYLTLGFSAIISLVFCFVLFLVVFLFSLAIGNPIIWDFLLMFKCAGVLWLLLSISGIILQRKDLFS